MKSTDEDKLAAKASKDERMRIAILSAAACGLTTSELVMVELAAKGIEAKERSVYDFLDRLSALRLFSISRPSIPGVKGSPRKLYRLTKLGEGVVKKIDPSRELHYTSAEETIPIRHRYCQLEMYTLACKRGWKADVEKNLPFYLGGERGVVRPDVILHTQDGPLYIEVEQTLATGERAEKKLTSWMKYSLATGEIPHIILCFSLNKNNDTLLLWQNALREVEVRNGPVQDFRYELSFLYMEHIRVQGKLPVDLMDFTNTLLPESYAEAAADQKSPVVDRWAPPKHLKFEMERLDELTGDWKNDARKGNILRFFFLNEGMAISPYAHIVNLLQVARVIYNANHNLLPGDMYRPLIPLNSIQLLRYYLTHPSNGYLRGKIKVMIKNLSRSGGITHQKMLIADVVGCVLDHFLISETKDGLQVKVKAPDYMRGEDTRFRIIVDIGEGLQKNLIVNKPDENKDVPFHVEAETTETTEGSTSSAKKLQPYAANAQASLQWMLEALILYKGYLGLVDYEDLLHVLSRDFLLVDSD